MNYSFLISMHYLNTTFIIFLVLFYGVLIVFCLISPKI